MSRETRFPDDMPMRVADRLDYPLPGRRAHRAMAAELSYGRHTGEAPFGARQAAVVVPLYPSHGRWHVLLTVRSPHLANHSGQISFPGGGVEPGEPNRAAALRELDEELGIAGSQLHVVGTLSPVYVLASNFHVTPWIAFMEGRPAVRPNLAEVSRVLEVPLAALDNSACQGSAIIGRGGLRFGAPHYAWKKDRIWGGTAMILSELLTVWWEATGRPRPL